MVMTYFPSSRHTQPRGCALEVHFMAEENKEILIVDDKTIQEKIYFLLLASVIGDIISVHIFY